MGSQPALLAATPPVVVDAPSALAQMQSAEAVAQIAQAITVRIEGATQGSGVLVKREGNRLHGADGLACGERAASWRRAGCLYP